MGVTIGGAMVVVVTGTVVVGTVGVVGVVGVVGIVVVGVPKSFSHSGSIVVGGEGGVGSSAFVLPLGVGVLGAFVAALILASSANSAGLTFLLAIYIVLFITL